MLTSIYKLKKVLWITIENALIVGLISTLIYNYIVCPWLKTPVIFVPYGVLVYWMLNLILRPPQVYLHINRPQKKGSSQSGLPENILEKLVPKRPIEPENQFFNETEQWEKEKREV